MRLQPAVKALRGGLARQALGWYLHAHGEWPAIWARATPDRAEAGDLIAELAEYIEPTEDVMDGLARARRRERAPKPKARRRR